MEESAFLNPASLAFFKAGSAYAQRDNMQFKDISGNIVQKPKNTAFVIADGNSSLSGSISYISQEEGIYKRKRWGLTTSAPLNEKSSFGASIRKTTDENTSDNSKLDYYQSVFGVTHAINETTSLGLVAYDVFNSKGDATRAYLGVQNVFAEYITLAFDLGANYKTSEITQSLLYRGSAQVKILDDFFLRFGAFNDKDSEEKGNAFGLGYVQPRLGFEFALKNTTQKTSITKNRIETKIRDTSFGVSLRF
jgi:hypothetical protein